MITPTVSTSFQLQNSWNQLMLNLVMNKRNFVFLIFNPSISFGNFLLEEWIFTNPYCGTSLIPRSFCSLLKNNDSLNIVMGSYFIALEFQYCKEMLACTMVQFKKYIRQVRWNVVKTDNQTKTFFSILQRINY